MDWPIREFCRMPIWFEGRKYYLRAKHRDTSARHIYELWLWPNDLHHGSTQSVVYDRAYVAERDQLAVVTRRRSIAYYMLLPFYPFLGLLWSRCKNNVLVPAGFEVKSITSASIALTFYSFFALGVFIGWLQGGVLAWFASPELQWLDWLIVLALGADSAMRFGQSLKCDVECYWGFCEWLFRRG